MWLCNDNMTSLDSENSCAATTGSTACPVRKGFGEAALGSADGTKKWKIVLSGTEIDSSNDGEAKLLRNWIITKLGCLNADRHWEGENSTVTPTNLCPHARRLKTQVIDIKTTYKCLGGDTTACTGTSEWPDTADWVCYAATKKAEVKPKWKGTMLLSAASLATCKYEYEAAM
ncbi:hypothetical protein TRVL_02014 [Trypanosoma vivax]|nr:hypothetical protein TRVL_02014 [Trypanosoma vivax]